MPALFDLAEPIPGPATEPLGRAGQAASHRAHRFLFEKRAPGVYHNTAVVFDADGSLRGLYRKMHIPDDPLYYEKYYFTPGDLGFRAFDTAVGRVGTLVCWDQWYPEGARLTALQGAQVLFYPTAIGWHPAEKAEFGAAQHDAWRTIQRAHAIANGVYVAVVNRVGHETGDIRGNAAPGDGLEFWGGSFLCDPFGRVIAEASHDKEEILVGEVDLRVIEDSPPQLALPARPPHRQLRPNHQPADRLTLIHEAPSVDSPLPHARRMGTPRLHLAGLAALPRRLAGKIRAHSLGLRRDHPSPRPPRAHRPDRQESPPPKSKPAKS